jgi:hypothetical protein
MDSAVDLRFQVRALSILHSFASTFVYPVPVATVHTVSYFCDALSPLWNFEPLDDIVLKTAHVPRSARLQRALDRLVGRGVVTPSAVQYVKAHDGDYGLSASYALNYDLARPVVSVLKGDETLREQLTFVRELASSLVAMGPGAPERAVFLDANYLNPLAGANSVLDLQPDGGQISESERAGHQFMELALDRVGSSLTSAEITAMYTEHVYRLLQAQQ